MSNSPEQNEALIRGMARIEGKQDLILHRVEQNTRDIDRQSDRISSVEGRVGKVENRVTYWAGGLTVLLGIVTFFGAKLREVLF